MISKIKPRMLLLSLKNGKCKISIIVFIAEKNIFLAVTLVGRENGTLSVYGRVTLWAYLMFTSILHDTRPIAKCSREVYTLP